MLTSKRYSLVIRTIVIALLLQVPAAFSTENQDDEDYSAMPVEPEAQKGKGFKFSFKFPFFKLDKEEDKIVHGGISILGHAIPPATSTRLYWEPQDTFESIAAPTPVLVLNGATPGPTLCLTGAVHGDEINGIEIIRRVFFEVDPLDLSGVLMGIPIVNQMGFRLTSRYLPDRRDLNRYFPGDPKGSSASRIAYTFFNEVIVNCDALVDIHTGSFHRTNAPQLRADMRSEKVAQLVHGFGGMIVLHSEGAKGTLRRAAVDAGIPSVTLEAGEPMRIQEEVVADGVERIRNLMTNLSMYKQPKFWSDAEPIYVNSRWVRSEQGGLLLSTVKVGDKVVPGDKLGDVVNPINNKIFPMVSPYKGRVIGMALNQVVMPGYAAYHIGIEATETSLELVEAKPSGANGKPAATDLPESD
ncbi:MAG: succinylglutamate desuccinylase/aspartoacylase family protein [Porticoccaceae bacterium]|nr:succinylglutamate desuccinylase/aspartoacylase family protein [Porticoccaceae bacterium]